MEFNLRYDVFRARVPEGCWPSYCGQGSKIEMVWAQQWWLDHRWRSCQCTWGNVLFLPWPRITTNTIQYRTTRKQLYSSLRMQRASQLLYLPWTNSTTTSTPTQNSHIILRSRPPWNSHVKRSTVIIHSRIFHLYTVLQWVMSPFL